MQSFDSACGPGTAGTPLNANHSWCGRGDTTELYFRDWEHILAVFRSDHVKQKVGPDGPLFADFDTCMVLMATEKPLDIDTLLAKQIPGQ
jgi:hypothetical protein